MALQDMAVMNGGVYATGSQVEQRLLQQENYSQHWDFKPINVGNSYVIENRETRLALNNSGGGTSNGTKVISWLNNSDNEKKDTRQWYIEKDTPKNVLKPSSVKEVKHEMDYVVLFDPVTKRLHFEAADRTALKETAEIFADNGTKVMQFNVAEDAVLTGLSQGVYILLWREGDTRHTVKFILK